MVSAGRKSSKLVLDVFEMIGGVEAMAEWAEQNKGDFYTKLFSKTITREADVNHTFGVEDMLDQLDAAEEDGIIDAEYEELTPEMDR